MKNKMRLLVLAIIFVTALLAIVTIESTDFDLQFSVNQNDSTIEAETVTLKGKIIKLPFDFYFANGSLKIDDKSYRINKYSKESSRYGDLYSMELVESDYGSFVTGNVFLSGDIADSKVESIYITIHKMNLNTGFSYSEVINCQIINR
jgi:major membrane immunogen (membrane-anchored lipoprotein)